MIAGRLENWTSKKVGKIGIMTEIGNLMKYKTVERAAKILTLAIHLILLFIFVTSQKKLMKKTS